MATGIPVHKDCVQSFENVHKHKQHAYVLYKIETDAGKDKEIVVDYRAEAADPNASMEECEAKFNEMKELLVKEGQPRYCVFDFRFTADVNGKSATVEKFAVISWCPDATADSKAKMYHSGSERSIKQSFQCSKIIQCNDTDELSFRDILQETIKGSGNAYKVIFG